MDAGRAHKYLIEVELLNGMERGGTDHGKRTGPTNGAAGEGDLGIRLAGKLHADIDCAGDEVDAFAVTKAARNLGGRGAGGERDGIAFGDHLGGGNRDATFFVGEAFFAKWKGGVEAKRFVGQFAGKLDAAVGTVDQTALLEFDEVAPDAGGGGADGSGEVFDAAGSLLKKQMKYLVCAIMCLCSHLEEVLSGCS